MPVIDTTFVDSTLVRTGDHLAVNPTLVTQNALNITAAAAALAAATAASAAAAAAAAASVPNNLYDPNTILVATADDTPFALTMPPSSALVRLASGPITAGTPRQLADLLFTSGSFQLHQPPTVAHADDEEFDSVTLPAGWELRNINRGVTITPSGSIDPYTALTTTGIVHMKAHTDWRRSFLAIQGSTEGTETLYTYAKPVTIPTNRMIYGRFGMPVRFGGDSLDAACGLGIFSDSGGHADLGNCVLWTQNELDGPIRLYPYKLVGGVGTLVNQGPDIRAGLGTVFETFCLHKLGNTYHVWAFTSSGQRHYFGSTTHASTMAWVGIFFKHGNSTTPANAIYLVDFIRHLDTTTQLPT